MKVDEIWYRLASRLRELGYEKVETTRTETTLTLLVSKKRISRPLDMKEVTLDFAKFPKCCLYNNNVSEGTYRKVGTFDSDTTTPNEILKIFDKALGC